MGRTEPTVVKPPAAFRRDARAKRARATLNKVIPAMVSAHPRARRGIERSELCVDPPAPCLSKERDAAPDAGGADASAAGRRKKVRGRRHDDEGLSNDARLSHEEKGADRGVGNAHSALRITLYVGDALSAAQALLSHSPSQHHHNQNQDQNDRHDDEGHTSAVAPRRGPKKVGVLNMASPLAAGGGFLNGATGPEASLCLRTTLLPALRDEFYRLPELGVVYTPDVLVFRTTTTNTSSATRTNRHVSGNEASGTLEDDDDEDVLPKNDRWFIDVASAAMLRLPETISSSHENGHHEGNEPRYALTSDRELAERKMRAVLRIFAARECGAVVLGAWGCGAHEGNPVSEIAAAWRRVLGADDPHRHHHRNSERHVSAQQSQSRRKENDGGGGGERGKEKKKTARNREKGRENQRESWATYFSDVVFAIQDRGTAAAFARAFGEEYLLDLPASLPSPSGSPSSTASFEGEGCDPVQVAREAELREKIARLEAQVAQVRSPHLIVGLQNVLAGLKRQLPCPDEDREDGVGPLGLSGECVGETDNGDDGQEDESDDGETD